MLACVAGGFPTGHKGMDGCGAEQKPVFRCWEVASRGTVHQLLLQPQLLGFLFLGSVQALHTANRKQVWAYPCVFVLSTSQGGQ